VTCGCLIYPAPGRRCRRCRRCSLVVANTTTEGICTSQDSECFGHHTGPSLFMHWMIAWETLAAFSNPSRSV